MVKKHQSSRLTKQHRKSHGVVGIFGKEAQMHDKETGDISHIVKDALEQKYPQLTFRYRQSVEKKEINEALQKIDPWTNTFCTKCKYYS